MSCYARKRLLDDRNLTNGEGSFVVSGGEWVVLKFGGETGEGDQGLEVTLRPAARASSKQVLARGRS